MNTREPSVHITKAQFLQVLDDLEIKAFPVDAFFRLASKRAINSRGILVKNKRTTKTVTKVLLASKGDTQLTADLLYAVRIKLHHRGVRKITEYHKREWSLCKELTSICNQFAETFQFESAREAFITYIEIGFKRMGRDARNWLNRLVSMSDNIFFYYESLKDTEKDDKPKKTSYLYEIYNRRIADATGIVDTEPLKENPEKYLHFFRLRRILDHNEWDYEDYIDAQFEAMSFCNGIPEPQNLSTQKAVDRYKKFLFKSNRNPNNEPKMSGSIWDEMSKLENG